MMRVKLRDQFAKWTHEGGGSEEKNVGRAEAEGKTRRNAKQEGQGEEEEEEEEGNTWPHPDFMHATTRAEEETERVEFAALPDHART